MSFNQSISHYLNSKSDKPNLSLPSLPALDNTTHLRAPTSPDPETAALERFLDWAINRFSRRTASTTLEVWQQRRDKGLDPYSNEGGFVKTSRVTLCGKPRQTVTLNQDDDQGRTHYSGLYYCMNVWRCSVCSWIIRRARSQEIEQAAQTHLNAGGGLVFATFTIRHHQGMPLSTALDTLKTAYSQMAKNKPFRAWKAQTHLNANITATEITYGKNGWHPHMHRLYFFQEPISTENATRLKVELFLLWQKAVEKTGGEASLDAFDFQLISQDETVLASYIAKVHEPERLGLELSLSDIKSGRKQGSLTPFQLLDYYRDSAAQALWYEYVEATKGKSAIRWSKGLRAKLGLQKEKTDDEIIDELEQTGVPVIEIMQDLYSLICEDAQTLVNLQRAAGYKDWNTAREILTKAAGLRNSHLFRILHTERKEDER